MVDFFKTNTKRESELQNFANDHVLNSGTWIQNVDICKILQFTFALCIGFEKGHHKNSSIH